MAAVPCHAWEHFCDAMYKTWVFLVGHMVPSLLTHSLKAAGLLGGCSQPDTSFRWYVLQRCPQIILGCRKNLSGQLEVPENEVSEWSWSLNGVYFCWMLWGAPKDFVLAPVQPMWAFPSVWLLEQARSSNGLLVIFPRHLLYSHWRQSVFGF